MGVELAAEAGGAGAGEELEERGVGGEARVGVGFEGGQEKTEARLGLLEVGSRRRRPWRRRRRRWWRGYMGRTRGHVLGGPRGQVGPILFELKWAFLNIS